MKIYIVLLLTLVIENEGRRHTLLKNSITNLANNQTIPDALIISRVSISCLILLLFEPAPLYLRKIELALSALWHRDHNLLLCASLINIGKVLFKEDMQRYTYFNWQIIHNFFF